MRIFIFFTFCFYILILFSIFTFLTVYIFNKIKLYKMVKNFASYISLLNLYLSKAYDIIYKDRILIFSVEATKIPEKDFSRISKDFIFLVFKMIGPNLKKEFELLYGNEESFIFTMLEYFNTRYEEDEIRKSATEELMEKEMKVDDEIPDSFVKI